MSTPSQILTKIQSTITTNGAGGITAANLGGILSDITNNLPSCSTYNMPLASNTTVTSCDIGLLMMNDGYGNATVYQLNQGNSKAILGTWTISPNSLNNVGNDAMISITSSGNNNTFYRNQWTVASGTYNPPYPNYQSDTYTLANEISNIAAYLTLQYPAPTGSITPPLTFIPSTDGNSLNIAETQYYDTSIYVNDMGFPIVTNTFSTPAMPPMPTAFPLGTLAGISSDGTEAIICSGVIQNYMLTTPLDPTITSGPSGAAGTFATINSLFNYNSPLPIEDNAQDLYALANQIIIPDANGYVTPFSFLKFINSLPDLPNNNNALTTLSQLNYQFIGFAISTSPPGTAVPTVAVYNLSFTSFIASIVLRLFEQSIVQYSKISTINEYNNDNNNNNNTTTTTTYNATTPTTPASVSSTTTSDTTTLGTSTMDPSAAEKAALLKTDSTVSTSTTLPSSSMPADTP